MNAWSRKIRIFRGRDWEFYFCIMVMSWHVVLTVPVCHFSFRLVRVTMDISVLHRRDALPFLRLQAVLSFFLSSL